jgi:hypothetical protein
MEENNLKAKVGNCGRKRLKIFFLFAIIFVTIAILQINFDTSPAIETVQYIELELPVVANYSNLIASK